MKKIDKDKQYQIQKSDTYRIRKIFSLLGFIIVNGYDNDFQWTGKWFKWIKIKEQKVKERYKDFDDGWSYQEYWKEWKENWKFIKII